MSLNIEQNVMDITRLTAALRATLDGQQAMAEAEAYLSQAEKIIGFAPTLLQILVEEQIDGPVRQAGAVYLKNLIMSHWVEDQRQKSDEDQHEQPQQQQPGFLLIHEQDRHILREKIIDAIILSPDVIRVQLTNCVFRMIRVDFPGKWPTIVDKIMMHLNGPDARSWMGALLVLYQLAKAYEFKKPTERRPLVEAMKIILPVLYAKMELLLPEQSQEANYLQKIILKIFYVLVQYSLNLNMLAMHDFAQWMELARKVVDRPVPQETEMVDKEDRPNLVWWKCKKWSMHLLTRIFERYGSPGQVSAEYNQFAEYYLKNFTRPSMHTALKVLEDHRAGTYASPPVLHQALGYVQAGIRHAFSWKIVKPHAKSLIQEVVFPLLCHNEEDEELWNEDPQEYISVKYDMLDELVNPSTAAAGLLSELVKRKGVLKEVVDFVARILDNSQSPPQHVDGALNIIGILTPNLSKKKAYKSQLEPMLVNYVFPRFDSPHGFLRSRASWCMQHYSDVEFKNEQNLMQVLTMILKCLLMNAEQQPIAVKVQAAMALHLLLDDQPKIGPIVQAQIKPIVLAMLKLISEIDNDELTHGVQKLINSYSEDVIPIAVEIAQQLSNIFSQLLASDESSDDKTLQAISVLNTLETVVEIVDKEAEIIIQLEPVVISVIKLILDNNVMDFYEEAFTLISLLTERVITENSWNLYRLIHDKFFDDAVEYFTDMMPALHNFITMDTQGFLSQPQRLEMLFNMCKQMLTNDELGDEEQMHAAKLLEVLILQYKARIDHVIRPVCELILSRLCRQPDASELRTMCLQVLIAALLYDPHLTLQTLQTFQSPNASMSVVDLFIKQWLCDTDCFLGVHDRKMYVIGLCILLGLMPQNRPPVLLEIADKLVPCCLILYDGLQKAYEIKAKRENADDSDDSGEEEEDDDDELDADALASEDDDEIDPGCQEYLEKFSKAEQDSGNDDAFTDDDDEDFVEETDLEAYETVLDGNKAELDEYVFFKETLHRIQSTEPEWYTLLVSKLQEDQINNLQKVFNLADQRQAAAESRKIDQTGGYQFNTQQIPTNFQF